MPINYKDYDFNWKNIRKVILQRAKNKCELCNAPNHAFMLRFKGAEYPWYIVQNATNEDLKKTKIIKVVLTIAHLDQDKKNNKPYNLLALCQRCHNKIDLPHRIKNRKNNRINKGES